MPKRKRTKKTTQRRPHLTGWLTTDADEIERRRIRAATESFQIEPEASDDEFYGVFSIASAQERSYRVEIRSLAESINSCNCPDHRVNGLGTCKHIEATLQRLQHRRKRAFNEASSQGSPYIEIFLDRRDQRIRILWPGNSRRRSRTGDLLAPFFADNATLAGEPLEKLPALQRTIDASPAAIQRKIRFSDELHERLETLDRRAQQQRNRQHFEAEVAAGRANLDLVKHRLYPYQQEGMLHLAYTGRALLADEMGLGKTVQAVAACELLRRHSHIKRVLVVSPASLKGEWEEQIAKFTDLPACIIQGTRPARLRQYTQPGFFYLANYEQIRPDVDEINSHLNPDVVILDEAQRIKNWQTKTAIAVKRLHSPYAFVLTGTPLENRIDEIYSITQFLDPSLFGPLFRFNRDYYQLDEKGRAIGYKNLDQLHAKLRPIMLRRRKEAVEGQLPGRTINTYLVSMHREQTLRYQDYEAQAARLAAIAKRRPLTKEEMEKLQLFLACMRMLCDTPYILDQACRLSPKLDELDSILQEILAEGEHKIIIFSEWERMLQLVRELAETLALGYAWHTGQVPQPKRRAEIRRFKDDPNCRLFLSTDSGALGLNLQVADVVINLDQPWNPAKLEQRIARAWRKHQKRPVQVINLVSEHTIEHRMLSLLEQKRALAEGVVDGQGESEMSLPSGRAAFLDRLDSLLATPTPARPAPPRDPLERIRDAVLAQWSPQIERMELYGEDDQQTLLVVAESLDEGLQQALEQQLQAQLPEQTPRLKLLDRQTFATIQELLEAGLLSIPQDSAKILYQASAEDQPTDDGQAKRLAEALKQMQQGRHKQRMAQLLKEGGFTVEALAPMREAVEQALQALLHWQGQPGEQPPSLGLIDSALVQTKLLPDKTLPQLARLRDTQSELSETEAARLIAQGEQIFTAAATALDAV